MKNQVNPVLLLRTKLALTQEEFAKIAGYKQRMISHIEKNERPLPHKNAKRIAAYAKKRKIKCEWHDLYCD